MFISKLVIRNFRNFKNASFRFHKGVNTLIGENGSGKTNAFLALRFLIDGDLPRNLKLKETDFNRSLGANWQGHWIIISVEFDELDKGESIQLLSHHVEHMDGSNKGKLSLYFRPNKSIRKRLYEASLLEDRDEINHILLTITINDYELVYSCRGTADFNDNEVYKMYVGDFERLKFPDPDVEAKDVLGIIVRNVPIYEDVTCTFVKALRDVVSDLKSTRHSPLLQLLSGSSTEISQENQVLITDKVNELNYVIGSLDKIEDIRRRIKATLNNTIGATYAPNVDVKSQLPDDMEKLLQSLTLWVGDPDDIGYQGQIHELSLGGANLIYISLKLLEYELKQSKTKAAHFLLIEEPEAHIHTHIQKTLFDKYHNQKTQVIISTHSTHISAASKISSVNILAKSNQEAEVYQPNNGLTTDEIKKIERYLDAVRSTLLFAKAVILVEGDAELILVPEMFKKVFNLRLDEIGISIINMNSTVFKHIALLFHEDRIKRRCAIITDLDKSIVPEDDDDYENIYKNSQEAGLIRKDELDARFRGNEWVEVFYAPHTFEVDFMMSGNRWEVKQVLNNIYQGEHHQTKAAKLLSVQKLDSEDIAIAGKEVLRLAKQVGKGWFALDIANYVNYRTNIPSYILHAIAFTSNHLNLSHLEIMANYRIQAAINDENEWDDVDIFKEVYRQKNELLDNNEYSVIEFLRIYMNNLPDDPLTQFIQLVGIDIHVK